MATNENKEKQIRRMIIKELPHFWLFCIASGVIALLIQLVGLIPPILMQEIIDVAIPSKNIHNIIMSIVWFCVIPFISTLLTMMYKYMLAIVCRKFGQHLAIRGFKNLVYQPIHYFDHVNSSELATYCRNEAINYIVFWVIDIPQLIATLLGGVIVLGYIAHLNIGVALLLLLYIPFSFFPSNYFASKVQSFSKRIINNNALMSQIINDTFKGIKFVKSMGLETLQIKKLETINKDSVLIWSRVSAMDNLSGLWVDNFSDTLFTGICFSVSALLVVTGQLSLGMLIIILNYLAKYLVAAKQLTHTNYNFKSQLGAYDKLFDILLMNNMENNGIAVFRFQKEILFDNVYFSYEENRGDVLQGIHFSVSRGEWLGIIGESGAGKTTIFDLLLRFYSPKAGHILADGIDLEFIDYQDLRKKIAKVSQEIFLFPGTLRENLQIVNPAATEEELWSVLEDVRLKNFVQNLENGIDTYIGENGLLLSGGEKQRLGLAQGLLRNAEILLLDEVTANIDIELEHSIMNILDNLRKERHLTIISISHRINFLALTDRIMVVENGQIQHETTYCKLAKSFV